MKSKLSLLYLGT